MTMTPQGPYDLSNQNRYFGGWRATADGGGIVMAFPVEGWQHSAAVEVRQHPDGSVTGTVAGTPDPGRAWQQALCALSLDVDGSGYPRIGQLDPVVGALQREHGFLRPVLFHSPYEAACALVIAHRLGIVQGRAIRERIAQRNGAAITVAGTRAFAFPTPQRLLHIEALPGLSDEKMRRLHGVARAALDGVLDRERLRRQPLDQAMAQTRMLRGIGDFFAAGIVLRGAGVVDAVPGDVITQAALQHFYGLPAAATPAQLDALTSAWRPYRMWCSVLVHVAERRRSATALRR
ncbi:DNA-3-methyladenine glycosylase family protein [Krasilnikovia sp. MM14-A1259]|uniref:DNA-3-methyladenine glycosylase family protein n=1 Tax=Krasilnikovia sp. MM14-A1259 TaxID=3373539 RepID=UPI00399CBC13